jgi:uncharacterized protein YcbK (DUF882 family)
MNLNYKTDNFKLTDVIHNQDGFTEDLIPIGMFAMGYLQGLRDALCAYYKTNIRLVITSGFRSKAYNATLKGASPNSHHVWRYLPDGRFVWAVDLVSPDLKPEELFKTIAEIVKGEVYLHRRLRFVHIAPEQLKDETFVV